MTLIKTNTAYIGRTQMIQMEAAITIISHETEQCSLGNGVHNRMNVNGEECPLVAKEGTPAGHHDTRLPEITGTSVA